MTRFIGDVRTRLGSLPAGVLVGALCGAFIGGVLGRLYMRLIFVLNPGRDGALTDFGAAGRFTVEGSLSLAMLCTVTGVIGGMLYVGVRRWLPGRTTQARGVAFGLLMTFGPAVIFISPVDLKIFEPALPIYLGFAALIVLYGVGVALLTDRMSPPRVVLDRHSRFHRVAMIAGPALLALAIVNMGFVVVEGAGTCLSGDGSGGCGAPAKK